MLEVILIVMIVVLLVVLVLETWEYRQAVRYARELAKANSAYTDGFNTMHRSVASLQDFHQSLMDNQGVMANQMLLIQALLEVHNRALSIDSALVDRIKSQNISPVVE